MQKKKKNNNNNTVYFIEEIQPSRIMSPLVKK